MSDAVNIVLKRVEDITGKPVLVQADPALTVIATSRLASASVPAHLIRYNPSAKLNADYLTCFQCGFIIRTFQTEPEARFEVGSTYRGRKDVEQLLRDHGRRPGATAVPKLMRDGIRDQIYDGLIRQLRSVPIGLRVDRWLLSEFPSLSDQQRSIALRQLNENLGALAPEIKKFAPIKIVEANIVMNCAFAAFWAAIWRDSTQSSPYLAAGFLSRGEELLTMLDELPPDPQHDRKLIQSWGDRLGLTGWFEFAPLRG